METGKTIMQVRTNALRTLTEYIGSHPGADRSCVPLLRPLIKCVFSSTEFERIEFIVNSKKCKA